LVAQSDVETENAVSTHSTARKTVFLTSVDARGEPVSAQHGPIRPDQRFLKWGLAVSVGLLLLLWFALPARTARVAPLLRALANEPSAVQASAVQPGEMATFEAADASWEQLVTRCKGDVMRAATIINGELAADPSLAPGSTVAVARAIARVH
jgi:hypothetical protein